MNYMKTGNSRNTKTMKYFCASFTKWFKESKLNQVEAGAIFDLSHTFISKLLKMQASISIGTAESIAEQIGKDVIGMLIEGRELLGEKPSKPANKEDPFQKAKEAFDYVLMRGGEAAELLADNAIHLAKKKRAEAKDPTGRQGYKSAS